MIKPKELRKKSDKELDEMLEQLEFDLMKERGEWGRGSPEEKSLKQEGKTLKGGTLKTSLQRDIRRLIAKVKTIQNERRRNGK